MGYKIKHGEYQQLTRAIPNNFISRWFISKVNTHLKNQGSRYTLQIRYRVRKPKATRGWFGDLKRHEAKKIGLYLVDRVELRKRANDSAKSRRKWKREEKERSKQEALAWSNRLRIQQLEQDLRKFN